MSRFNLYIHSFFCFSSYLNLHQFFWQINVYLFPMQNGWFTLVIISHGQSLIMSLQLQKSLWEREYIPIMDIHIPNWGKLYCQDFLSWMTDHIGKGTTLFFSIRCSQMVPKGFAKANRLFVDIGFLSYFATTTLLLI